MCVSIYTYRCECNVGVSVHRYVYTCDRNDNVSTNTVCVYTYIICVYVCLCSQVVPWDYNFLDDEYHGIFISNGPGDPVYAQKVCMRLCMCTCRYMCSRMCMYRSNPRRPYLTLSLSHIHTRTHPHTDYRPPHGCNQTGKAHIWYMFRESVASIGRWCQNI